MGQDFYAYDDPSTIDKRARVHGDGAASELSDQYIRHADEFITLGFPVYCATFDTTFSPSGSAENIISIFNADATIRVRVIDIEWRFNQKNATQKIGEYGTITSVHSGGTLLNKRPFDVGGAGSDADVTVRGRGQTATLANRYKLVPWDASVEAMGVIYDQLSWDRISTRRSIILRQNQGFLFRAGASFPTQPMAASITWQEWTP